MYINSISNNINFNAKVHMDLMVKKAYKTNKDLRDTVEILKQVECDDIYLVRCQRAQSASGSIMGQSIHADGRLDETELGYYNYDSRNDTYSVYIPQNKEDMLSEYNWRFYYKKHNAENFI